MCFVEERNLKIVGNGFSGVSGRDDRYPLKYQKVNGLWGLGGGRGRGGARKGAKTPRARAGIEGSRVLNEYGFAVIL